MLDDTTTIDFRYEIFHLRVCILNIIKIKIFGSYYTIPDTKNSHETDAMLMYH